MTAWLSVVVPTAGQRHAGLLRAVDSIRFQQRSDDDVEVLVIADTHGTPDRAALDVIRVDVSDSPRNCRYAEWDGGTHCYGQPQRTYGSKLATGDWVAYSQDDDIFTEHALAYIWNAVHHQPRKRPLFFQVTTFWGETVWRDRTLHQGNIDADCLVLPRSLAKEITWGMRYEGDFDAAVEAMKAYSGDVGWCPKTIAVARPGETWWQ